MLGLPQSTEVRKQLPKAQIYSQFNWNHSQRESFDADISRLDFVNWISPRTMGAVAPGHEVKEVYVVHVTLKNRNFNRDNLALLSQSIPQRIIYILSYKADRMLAVYHDKLFTTQWRSESDLTLPLSGLDLDGLWQNAVSHIGAFAVQPQNSLSEQIRLDTERAKLEKRIADLERKMRAERQPRRKRELFDQLNKLKSKPSA